MAEEMHSERAGAVELKLGDRVKCFAYIKPTKNHYEITTGQWPDTGPISCMFWAGGAEEGVKVEDFHSCDRFRTIRKGDRAMNRHLSRAIQQIEKIEALMYAYEKTYLDLAVEPEEQRKADMAISTFYAIWDYIREVAGDLEHLEGDCRVVDAIYAVNDVRRRESTLTTE